MIVVIIVIIFNFIFSYWRLVSKDILIVERKRESFSGERGLRLQW